MVVASNDLTSELKQNTNHESLYSLMSAKELSHEAIKQRSLEILGKMRTHQHTDFNLANGAKEFLENLLHDGSVDIHIISKNHEEYIRAVLLFNGLSEDLVNCMQIHDCRPHLSKYACANRILDLNAYSIGSTVIVCDDSLEDKEQMMDSVLSHSMKAISSQVRPGKFDFPAIEAAIKESRVGAKIGPMKEQKKPEAGKTSEKGLFTPTEKEGDKQAGPLPSSP